jgi:transposase
MLTAEKNRLRTAAPSIRKSLRTHRAWLRRERTPIDAELAQAIQDSPVCRDKDELLRSIPAVGPVLTTIALANLPELGTVTNKQIAALAGVVPLNRDNGTLHGKRMVWGGRAQVPATGYNPRQSRRSISACVGWAKPRRWLSSPVCRNC